jgi:hypothetical protein
MKDKKPVSEFDEIVRMIEQSRSRAFQKVNEELVMLYFTIGKTVPVRVSDGVWGDKTVDELSAYLLKRFPGLRRFTRRGLYRMKQFFETYSPNSECYKLWLEVQGTEKLSQFVSPVATQLDIDKMTNKQIVSSMMTQLQSTDIQYNEVVEYSMARNTSPAMIADYETKLIPKKLLASKLNQLIELFSKKKN